MPQNGRRVMRRAGLLVLALLSVSLLTYCMLVGDRSGALRGVVHADLTPGTRIDLGRQVFVVSNSGHASPTPERDCNTGTDPVNAYPFSVVNSPRAVVEGGLFMGRVPQNADWQASYCNSAAIRVENSPGIVLTGLRIDASWDAVRIGPDSPSFMLVNSWISNARDDCLENDYLAGGTVQNVLFEDCFSGISIASPDPGRRVAPGAELRLDGVLMRMRPAPYKGRNWHAMPIKTDGVGPSLSIRNSVFAISGGAMIGDQNADAMWQMIESCDNNKLLVLDPGAPDHAFRNMPDCFEVIKGAEARLAWASARSQWLSASGFGE